MLRILFSLLVLVPLSSGAAAGEMHGIDSTDLTRRISRWIAPLNEVNQVSGTVLIAKGGTILFEQSYGMADYELRVPNVPSTRFNIASVSKNLTQIAMLSLMSDEQLAEPIAKWLPDFPAAEQITPLQLAEHRSGIPHRVTSVAEEIESQTAETMTSLAAEADLLFEPGTERSYSSAGYSVLARVLEVVADARYEDLLHRLVIAPVGAIHAAHPSPFELIDNRARGYFYGTHPIASPQRNLSFLVGAGSVYATPRDLFLIQRGLIEGRYGAEVRARLMAENGLRWNGYSNGYRTFADFHPADDLIVIFAGNTFTGAADLIRDAIPRIVRGEDVAPAVVPEVVPVAVSDLNQRRVEGSYRLGSSEQRLVFRTPALASLGDWILIPIGDDRFFSPQDYADVKAVSGDDGIEALQWGGGPRFPRVQRP